MAVPPPPQQGPRRARREFALAASCALLALWACRAAPPEQPGPLVLPELTAEEQLFAGTSLRGAPASAAELDADPARAVRVRVSILALEHLPAVAWTPLATHSRFVADLRNTDPLVGAAQHLVGARFATGATVTDALGSWNTETQGRIAQVAELDELLPFGTTASLGIEGSETLDNPLDWLNEHPDGAPVAKLLRVLVGNTAEGVGVALVVEDVEPGWWRPIEEEQLVATAAAAMGASTPAAEATPATETDGDAAVTGTPAPGDAEPAPAEEPTESTPPRERRVLRRELVLLDVAPAPGEPLLVLMPSLFESGEARAFACTVEVSAAELDSTQLEDFAARIGELRAAAEARAAAQPFDEAQLTLLKRTAALEALAGDATRRAALLFYAEGLQTPLVDDLALAATDELMASYATELLGNLQAFEPEALETLLKNDAALGLRFEASAYRLLADRAARADLEPELAALLLRHAGEAGRFPTALEDALAGATSVADLELRFHEENTIFLEDSSPAARVRAYDWLELRGAAPENYDPLAARDERRAALRAHEDALAAGTDDEREDGE